MKKDRDLLNKGTDDILDFIVKDCKGSTGDFSSTYVIDVTIAIDDVPVSNIHMSRMVSSRSPTFHLFRLARRA